VLTVVEQAKPGCVGQTEQLRQFAWLGTTNAALAGAQRAAARQRRATRRARAGRLQEEPAPVLRARHHGAGEGDNARAAQYWPRVLEATHRRHGAAGARAARRRAAEHGDHRDQHRPERVGDRQAARSREAADAIRAFLAGLPDQRRRAAHAGAARPLLSLSGDKAGVSAVYAEMLREPAKYDDLALTNAGVIASQAQAHADAAKLFDAALAKNAYQRDALNNLTATYLELKRFDAMIPVARRLVAVDPANPDNQLFLALAYQGLMNAAKAPAQKKAFADSLVKYNQASQSMPVKVTFNEFTRGESRAVLGMNVEAVKPNAAAAAASGAAGRRGRRGCGLRARRAPLPSRSSSSTRAAPWSTRSR
jgi:tetratricopeptide (TPR) repeat protein